MRCQPTAPQSPCSGPASVLAVHGLQESPEDRRGGLRGIKGVSRYPKSLPWSLHRHVSDNLRCSKQSRFFRRVLSILPPSPLSATAHLQPLAQPTALRHPGSRCDIDSHPDCRPFLILIVAPQATPFGGRDRSGSALVLYPVPPFTRARHPWWRSYVTCLLLAAGSAGWCGLVAVAVAADVVGRWTRGHVAADVVGGTRHIRAAGVRHTDQWCRGQHRCRAVGRYGVSRYGVG